MIRATRSCRACWRLRAAGLLGTGLGLGMPEVIPVGTSDYIFAAIAEEFGIIVAIGIIALYLCVHCPWYSDRDGCPYEIR